MDVLPEQLTQNEKALLQRVLEALRSLRYGTVILTMHEGRLVEMQKTERIRLK